MALFRLPAFRGGILEQNIARTAGSVGEALVAGAIFTIPAFLMVEINGVRLWSDLRSHYWEASLILLVGGSSASSSSCCCAARCASKPTCRFRKAWRVTRSSAQARNPATHRVTFSVRWPSAA